MFFPIAKKIWAILAIMVLEVASVRLAFPVLTLAFFDESSRLVHSSSTFAERSYWYGLCIAIPGIISIITSPFMSALSDSVGRKAILGTAIVGTIITMLLSGAAIYYGLLPLLIIGVIFQGLLSRTNPIAQAIVGDQVQTKDKVVAMGILQAFISFGAFFGPIIGTRFTHLDFPVLNYSTPFFIAAGFAMCALAFTMFGLDAHPAKTERPKVNLTDALSLLKRPDVLLITSILFFSQFSWSLYYQYLPPMLKTLLDFSGPQIGTFIGLTALWLTLSSLFVLPWLKRLLTLGTIIKLSIIVELIGLLLTWLGLTENWQPLVWISAAVIALGDIILYCAITTLYSNITEKKLQGSIMGVCFLAVSIMWSVTGLLGGTLLSINPTLPAALAPLGAVIALWLATKLKKEKGQTT
jgi:DHA1 family tetracycline resistance protein-like MFS transporter